MATIQKIEDIKVWQMARELSRDIYRITRYPEFNKDVRFISQIRASVGSIMDNIAEGFGREGNKEFIQFLWVAKGSAMEVKSQLYRACDVGFIPQEEFGCLLTKVEDINVKISNFVITLKDSEIKGAKYIAKTPQKEGAPRGKGEHLPTSEHKTTLNAKH